MYVEWFSEIRLSKGRGGYVPLYFVITCVNRSLQYSSNAIWPFKIYLFQINASKIHPKLKMKTPLEVLTVICPRQALFIRKVIRRHFIRPSQISFVPSSSNACRRRTPKAANSPSSLRSPTPPSCTPPPSLFERARSVLICQTRLHATWVLSHLKPSCLLSSQFLQIKTKK